MKKWSDLAIFDQQSPALFFADHRTRYYQTDKAKEREITILPKPPPWSLLWATAIYDTNIIAGCHYRREFPTFLALEYVIDGTLLFRQDERAYLAEPGDLCLMLPWHYNEFMTGPNGHCHKLSLLLIGSVLTDLLRHSGLDQVDILEFFDQQRFFELIDQFKRIFKNSEPGSAEILSNLAYEAIQMLAQQNTIVAYPEALEILLFYMESHLAERLSLVTLAQVAHCTPAGLIRLFRKYLNTTPHQMLTGMRMDLARRLLVERGLSIKEIALRSGYENSLNFSTAFRKYYGYSPSVYRLEYENNLAART